MVYNMFNEPCVQLKPAKEQSMFVSVEFQLSAASGRREFASEIITANAFYETALNVSDVVHWSCANA